MSNLLHEQINFSNSMKHKDIVINNKIFPQNQIINQDSKILKSVQLIENDFQDI